MLAAEEEYRAAYPLADNPLPAYPAALLQRNLARQEVVVRVIIAGEGNVVRFEASSVVSQVDPLYQNDGRPSECHPSVGVAPEPARLIMPATNTPG